jgi:Tfp pilus assembly protein PilF
MHVPRTVVLLAALTLAGCAAHPVKDLQRMLFNKGEPQLAAGIKEYEDGNYEEATGFLQSALSEGVSRSDEVKAHKYLAFIHCSARRETECRGEFTNAFEIDPAFDLNAAEAGHPMWGPIFRSVKGAQTTASK